MWKKHGTVFRPDTTKWWSRSHAMIPTPEQVDGPLYRIYFSGRDDQNRSQIGHFMVSLERPAEILSITEEPVLSPGRLGAFDDNGVSPSCLVKDGDRRLLYYIGWNPGSTTRMHIYGGLAISASPEAPFQRWSEAPIIERCRVNPFINTGPFVVRHGGDWFMYYVSGVEWVHRDLPRYNIQLATSRDGHHWQRDGHVCIDFAPGENALARPYVVIEDGLFKMWFASKGEAYQLRYAESADGRHWERRELVGLDTPAPDGSDAEMTEYACVLRHGGKRIMYYNGNNYGQGGILLATEDVP